MAVKGKSVMTFNAIAIPSASVGMPSCVNTMVKPIIAPPATGGTAKAAAELLEELGAEVVRIAFLIELKGLNGRDTLKNYDVRTVVQYEGK